MTNLIITASLLWPGLITCIFFSRPQILQNLGKADRTVDDVFDEYDANFTRQQTNANRLHKEVSNYLRCCRGERAPAFSPPPCFSFSSFFTLIFSPFSVFFLL